MAGAAIPRRPQASQGSQTSNDFYFNPIDPAFRDNPYPHYPALLSGAPRKFNVFIPTTLVARYADCLAVLRDPEHFSSRPPAMLAQLRAEFGPFAGATTMLDSDPPVHTRLRRLVTRAFTSRRVKDIEPRIRAIAEELLGRIARKGDFDLMNDFAGPLPVIVIAEMLGVPAEEHTQFKTWSNQIIEGGRGSFRGVAPGEQVEDHFEGAARLPGRPDRAAPAHARRGSHHRAGAGP